jgi:hypothetical protein
MARPVYARPSFNQFLGNSNAKEVHDLKKEQGACQIDTVLRGRHGVVFFPDTVEQAHREEYDDCGHCIGVTKR